MSEMKPFRCLNCGITFGMTDGLTLHCGEYAVFTLKVTPTCKRCGEHRTWRPVALQKNDIVISEIPLPTQMIVEKAQNEQ